MAGNNIQCNQVKRDYQNQLDNEKNTEAHFLLIHFVLFSFLLAGQPPFFFGGGGRSVGKGVAGFSAS